MKVDTGLLHQHMKAAGLPSAFIEALTGKLLGRQAAALELRGKQRLAGNNGVLEPAGCCVCVSHNEEKVMRRTVRDLDGF